MPRMSQEQIVKILRTALPPFLALCAVVLVVWSLSPTPPPPTKIAQEPPPIPPYNGVSLECVITKPAMEPWGVAGIPSGKILVTDRRTNDLLILNSKGETITSARKNSEDKDILQEPTGLCWDEQSKSIFVTDTGHHRVAVFDENAQLKFTFGRKGQNRGEFSRPVGIASNGKGKIFVVQVDEARLQVFDTKGQFIEAKKADELGMDYLWDVACLPSGCVGLSSALGGLTIYDERLKPKASLADRGMGRGYYLFTTGLAADDEGRVLACAKTQGKVMLLSPPTEHAPRGHVLTEILSTDGPDYGAVKKAMLASYGTMAANEQVKEQMQHSLRYPMDVAFLPGKRLAVAERGNGRVLVFKEL